MVTIKQVALEAGVSTSTVSRYISNKGYVGDDSRKKIKDAIDKLGYRPNIVAQSLKMKKSNLIGLLLPDISNPFFPRLAKGVEAFLKEKGYRVILGNLSNEETLEEYVNMMIQSNAAGVITTQDFTEKYPSFNLPVVIVDQVGDDVDFGVFSDNINGGKLAAQTIVEAGTRNLLLIKGPVNYGKSIEDRYFSAKEYLNLSNVKYLVEESSSFEFEEIQKEAKITLEKYKGIDSIIAPSDIHAIAYIHELLSKGIKIPDEVQIIGYDDITISQLIYPSLSTIHQSSYTMGYTAAELVYKLTNSDKIDQNRVKLPVYYVERDTIRRRK